MQLKKTNQPNKQKETGLKVNWKWQKTFTWKDYQKIWIIERI